MCGLVEVSAGRAARSVSIVWMAARYSDRRRKAGNTGGVTTTSAIEGAPSTAITGRAG
jgi:hypothetical protein